MRPSGHRRPLPGWGRSLSALLAFILVGLWLLSGSTRFHHQIHAAESQPCSASCPLAFLAHGHFVGACPAVDRAEWLPSLAIPPSPDRVPQPRPLARDTLSRGPPIPPLPRIVVG